MDWLPEDILDYTEDKFRRSIAKLKGPLLIAWEITNACDMSCQHCALDSSYPLPDELGTDEAKRVIDQLQEAGLKQLLFVGGEPLVRPDLLELARYASQFFTVAINTNAFSLDWTMAVELKEAGVSQVRISIDGADARTHDFLRREGSFTRAIEAVKYCVQMGFEVGIQATISQINFTQLSQMVDMARGLKVRVFEASEFFPVGRGMTMAQWVLSSEQRQEMYQFIVQKQKESEEPIITSKDPYLFLVNKRLQHICLNPYRPELSVGCGAGILGCAIKANGKVTPCGGISLVLGDLRYQRFSQIWQEAEALKILRARNFKGKCGSCEYKFTCGGCRAMAFLAGDLAGEDSRCWYQPLL